MTGEDRLEAALDSDLAAFAAPPDVRDLVETADEVGGAFSAWHLDGDARARIYARSVAGARDRGIGERLRALGLDRRVQAMAGGGVVTLAAATAVAVALVRGRRHAPARALGA